MSTTNQIDDFPLRDLSFLLGWRLSTTSWISSSKSIGGSPSWWSQVPQGDPRGGIDSYWFRWVSFPFFHWKKSWTKTCPKLFHVFFPFFLVWKLLEPKKTRAAGCDFFHGSVELIISWSWRLSVDHGCLEKLKDWQLVSEVYSGFSQ